MQVEKKPHGIALPLSLAYSLVGASVLFLTAASCGELGLAQASSGQGSDGLTPLFIIVLGTAWCGALLLPGAWLAIRRLQSRKTAYPPAQPVVEAPRLPDNPRAGRLLPVLAMVVYPLVLLLGSLVARRAEVVWWALPPLHILAATLPVFWLAYLALRNLQAGSALRRWGVFGIGLALAPALIIVIEIGAILVAVLALAALYGSDQSRLMELTLLAQRLRYSEADPEAILRLVGPFLIQPGVIFGAFAFVAAFVPMVEELIKPLGVWLIAGRRLSPTEGFAAGVLSGAGYALFENLFITAPGEAWALVSLGRLGTTTMHIFAAGISGYALASAWSQRRYLRLGVLFFAAVSTHALWNSLTLLSLAGSLPASLVGQAGFAWLGQVVVASLVALCLALLLGLVVINRRLRRYAIIPVLTPEPATAAPAMPGEPTSADPPTS